MRIIWQLVFFFSVCVTSGCYTEHDATPDSNAIEDKVYSNQFGALQKAQQVEELLLDAVQNQRQAIDDQSGQ